MLHATGANVLWSADFKGPFKTGDGRKCYPLTVSDNYSRYLLVCQCCWGIGSDAVQRIYRRGFEEYGVPDAVRTDNGWPFAASSLGGLGPLGVWLVKLDVMPERIKPGCPQQNGRHERMHRTLKEATATPPAGNARAQQRAFNRFRREYNEQRPHHSLKLGQCPGDVYQPSPRRYREQFRRGIQYPAHLQVRQVRHCGSIK